MSELNVTVDPPSNMTGATFLGSSDPQSDSIWILSSTFIIFTMQSGFGLLESGSVSMKNEVNIMVKNAVDVIFGGLTYWMFGYGLSFGEHEPYVNRFCGWGDFFVSSHDTEEKLGWVYSKFFFQASFATTATTIVSGGMAERTKLESYIIFSFFNTFVFCFPAHWMWGTKGWLLEMGAVDIAGAGPVHLVGGVTALVATVILKPRHGRYKFKHQPEMGSPTNAILGMFMLWWGWLGFNCGSTFGISGQKWKLAARSAVSTLCASMGGGFVGIVLSYVVKKRKFDVAYIINGVLGSLVGITAFCALAQPWEGIVIGAIGALITNGGVELLDKLKVDDPVGCIGTHALSGTWSLLAVGFFARKDMLGEALAISTEHSGVFQGGGFYLLGVQALAVVSLVAWTLVTSFVILKCIDMTIGLRIPLNEELLGADLVEHGIGDGVYDKITRTLVPHNQPENNVQFNGSSRTGSRRHSLGKRRGRRKSEFLREGAFSGDSIDMQINETHSSENVNNFNSLKKPEPSKKSKPCGCFSGFARRKNLPSPRRLQTLNGYISSPRHKLSSDNHSISAIIRERKRTDFLRLKYRLHENGSSNVLMGNGNIEYGLSRDNSGDFHSFDQNNTNNNESNTVLSMPEGFPNSEYEITYM